MSVRGSVHKAIRKLGYDIVRQDGITKPTDGANVEVLLDPEFQASVEEVRDLTLLDTARLANLWQLCRMSNPLGAIIEVGAYKGGSALHVSNSCPNRRIYVCDTFSGFGDLSIDASLDRLFRRDQFTDGSLQAVKARWQGKGRDVVWVQGCFPASAGATDIDRVSFAHIDVDLCESTAETLEYLEPRFTGRAIVVFDDFLRNADGVMKAVREFELRRPDWRSFPLFPGQGVMVHRSWFDR